MIAQITTPTYTPSDYLTLETSSEIRHEYINGAIIPMTGGTPNHNLIILNIASILHFALKGQGYYVFVTDQRIWIPDFQVYTYPDVMIVKGDLIFQNGRNDTITNPVAIVEVLSKTTANYDRSQKFLFYRSIPTFQEYILIDQHSISVQHYQEISATKWEFEEFNQLTDELQFSSINCTVTLGEIYEKVAFVE